MNYIERKIQRLNSLTANDYAVARGIVNDIIANEDEKSLVSLNQEQLLKGQKSDGSRTEKYKDDGSAYNPNYYFAKAKKGGGDANPFRDYFNSGEFFSEMFAKSENGLVYFGSNDSKTRFLDAVEGVEMFGLTEDNKVQIWNKNINKIRDAILRYINS